MERIYGPFSEPVPDLSIDEYFTTEEMIQDNSELVEKFTAAMKGSQQFAEQNHDIVREVIVEYTTTEPEILEQTTVPRFPQEHRRESLQQIIDMSERIGLISEPNEVEELLIDGAQTTAQPKRRALRICSKSPPLRLQECILRWFSYRLVAVRRLGVLDGSFRQF